ncbi:autotransporter assembly complex family protein [Thalassococcus sp. S3]|uniref:autotransporter assembly complex protein TamA n=1 Tax=Thalassococcus sp. S3 TaxID=2017482 RepID=UPI0010242F95|nr:autotransporter assembly complex family protein [Thalassococcus sp. S3]QBF31904.1 hypothetical protein CFI11_11830 [Thalassococcus sp. S3]
MRFYHRTPSRIAIAFACVLLSSVKSFAFETRLQAPGVPEDIVSALQSASLIQSLPEEERGAGQQVLAAARADYARLTAVLYDAGFFAPVISIQLDGREAAAIPVVRAPDRVARVVIAVEPGAAFRFGRADIAPLPSDAERVEAFASGETAKTSVIRSAVDQAVSDWRDDGYAKAEPGEQQITARHPEQRLDVAIRINPGPRLRFGSLILSGNSNVRPERIREITGLPEGQVFSPEELDRARNRLQRTGTFRIVSLTEAEQIDPPDRLPIELEVSDRLPRTFGFGAEISSLQGLTLSGYWLHRNLLGGAERLRFDAEVSGIGGDDGGVDYRLGARFDRPAERGPDTDFYAEAELESLDEVSFSSDKIGFELGFVNRKTLKRTYTYGLGLEHARTEDAFGDRRYTVFTIPLSAELDYRNSDVDATDGAYGKLELTPFAALSGTDSGLRALLDLRAYRSVGERVTFAVRGQVGALVGPDLEQAPADYLFFSGGGGTVRGQPYQSLGITLPSGEDVGGRSFLGLSGEVRIRTGDRLSVVGFVDGGYIGREAFPDGSSGEWHSGAGVGVRYDTGVGPIRFDVAAPTSGPGENSGVEIYIGIGQAF